MMSVNHDLLDEARKHAFLLLIVLAVMDEGPFALSRRSAHAGVPLSPSRA
jgi:hypothetical protein